MHPGPFDLAQTRLDNALALFEEFVRMTARHADAATLRGLEGRFAERVQIQPSYWSQIKGRSRQIGERLARQFEQLCLKPNGWMDVPHGSGVPLARAFTSAPGPSESAGAENLPRDDDERFIVGLVLTYYRRHPQRARTRLLGLLGEVLTPASEATTAQVNKPTASPLAPGVIRPPPRTPAPPAEPDPQALWRQTQAGVAPLKRKK